jgi:hypothetical protein
MLNNKEAKMSINIISRGNWDWWVEEGRCTALEGNYTFPINEYHSGQWWTEEGRLLYEYRKVLPKHFKKKKSKDWTL